MERPGPGTAEVAGAKALPPGCRRRHSARFARQRRADASSCSKEPGGADEGRDTIEDAARQKLYERPEQQRGHGSEAESPSATVCLFFSRRSSDEASRCAAPRQRRRKRNGGAPAPGKGRAGARHSERSRRSAGIPNEGRWAHPKHPHAPRRGADPDESRDRGPATRATWRPPQRGRNGGCNRQQTGR